MEVGQTLLTKKKVNFNDKRNVQHQFLAEINSFNKTKLLNRIIENCNGTLCQKLRTRYRKFRVITYKFLQQSNNAFGMLYNIVIFSCIIFTFMLSALADLDTNIPVTVNYLEIGLAIYFLLEFIIRLWAAGANAKYQGFKGRMLFMQQPICIFDILILFSSIYMVGVFSFPSTTMSTSIIEKKEPNKIRKNIDKNNAFVDFIRFIQIFRLLHIDRKMTTWKLIQKMIKRNKFELLAAYYITFMVFVTLAVSVYTIENENKSKQIVNVDDVSKYGNEIKNLSNTKSEATFDNLGDAFWFSIVSVLTIGYGDIVPKQWQSKVIVCLFSYLGMSLFSAASGLVGVGMSLTLNDQNKERKQTKTRDVAARLIQAWYRFHLISNENFFYSITAFRKQCRKIQQAKVQIQKERTLTREFAKKKFQSRLSKGIARQFTTQNINAELSPNITSLLVRTGTFAIPEMLPTATTATGNIKAVLKKNLSSSSSLQSMFLNMQLVPPLPLSTIKKTSALNNFHISEDNLSSFELNEASAKQYRAILQMFYFFTFITLRKRFKRTRKPYELIDAEMELCEMEHQRAQKFKELEQRFDAVIDKNSVSLFTNSSRNSKKKQVRKRNLYKKNSILERLTIYEIKAKSLQQKLEKIEKLAELIYKNIN